MSKEDVFLTLTYKEHVQLHNLMIQMEGTLEDLSPTMPFSATFFEEIRLRGIVKVNGMQTILER